MIFHSQRPEDSEVYRVSTQPNLQLSPNFQLHEFQCKDGTDVLLLHPRLVELCQRIRDHFGRPIEVNSGFRTHAYNEKIGGADESRHLWGMAGDLDVKGVQPEQVAQYAESRDVGGLGRYRTFTHVDVQGKNRRWDRQ